MGVEEMKIDGAPVHAAALTPASREIVTGIEDEFTVELPCKPGCRIGQGYALPRPMESSDFLSAATVAPLSESNALEWLAATVSASKTLPAFRPRSSGGFLRVA